MSKIGVKMELKSSDSVYRYTGNAVRRDNKITFSDNGVVTVITLGDVIYLERKCDYYIKLGFLSGKYVSGTYTSAEGSFDICVYTKEMEFKNDCIKIVYDEKINSVFIDTFILNLSFGIDT